MATFKYDLRAMLRKFGVVTVMDVEAYKTVRHKTASDESADVKYEVGEWDALNTFKVEPVFTLNSLKIANINQEGPTKSITGGQNADTLLKYGKTFTIEMQDALGRYDVLENIYGAKFSANHQIVTFTDRFPGELTLVGTTFVIDQATGAKQPIKIVIPIFLGDGIFNLTQDAEGDASVFDINGNILKFEGGAESADALPTEEERFNDSHTDIDGHIYGAGADNEFYFMCTKEIYETIAKSGYREAWNTEITQA